MNIRQLVNNKLFGDALYYYLGKIIPGIIAFLIPPILIRVLGVSLYGEYSLLQSCLLLVSTFVTGWLGQSFMRFYTSKEDKHRYTGFYYKLTHLLNSFTAPIIFIVIIYIGYSWYFAFVYALTYICLNVFSLLTVENTTKLLSKKVVVADGIRAIVFITLPLILYLFKDSFNEILLIYIYAGSLVSYVIAGLLLKKSFFLFKNLSLSIQKAQEKLWTKEMLNYGLPVAFWMVTAYLLNISDRYVINYFLDLKNVGIYSAVYDIFYKLMTFAFMPLLMAFQPLIIKFYNEGEFQKVKTYLRRVTYLLLGVFVILFAIIYFTKYYIITLFLKLEYIETIPIVFPIFIGAFIWNFSMFIHKPLELKKKTKIMLYGVLAAFTINIISNIILIPHYGITAAAYTTLVSTATYLLYVIISLKLVK